MVHSICTCMCTSVVETEEILYELSNDFKGTRELCANRL